MICQVVLAAPTTEPSEEDNKNLNNTEAFLLEQFQCRIDVFEATANNFKIKESWSRVKSKLVKQVENYKECKSDPDPLK